MAKEKTNLYLLAIVAIVAIVSIVVIILNNGVSSWNSSDLSGATISGASLLKTTTSISCSDSDDLSDDDGLYDTVDDDVTYIYTDPSIEGTVTVFEQKGRRLTLTKYTDICTRVNGDAAVIEYSCSGNFVNAETIRCSSSYSCVVGGTGACEYLLVHVSSFVT